MRPLEIKKDVFWAGAIDWSLRDFHGYSTEKGSTYNAFVVKGTEKTALFDTAKYTHFDEFVRRLREVYSPEDIDYIVVNHAEMDHSGCLPQLVEMIRPEKIFLSKPCKDAITEHFGKHDWPYHVVKTGDEISLGGKTVTFIEAKMLHWPDSMFSYVKEDRLLISSDAFGQHYATSERFDDEVNFSQLMYQLSKYYANILLPYSPMILKILDLIEKLGFVIDMIAPDHGVIWRKNVSEALNAYRYWAKGKAKNKAIIVYDTMWKSTEKMAVAVGEGLMDEGISTSLLDLRVWHHSDVVTELLDSRGIAVGSSTLNNEYLPRVADMFCYIRGLRPQKKVGFAFGSYGWGGESIKLLNKEFEAMKIPLVHPGVRAKYVPEESDFFECETAGRELARVIKEYEQG